MSVRLPSQSFVDTRTTFCVPRLNKRVVPITFVIEEVCRKSAWSVSKHGHVHYEKCRLLYVRKSARRFSTTNLAYDAVRYLSVRPLRPSWTVLKLPANAGDGRFELRKRRSLVGLFFPTWKQHFSTKRHVTPSHRAAHTIDCLCNQLSRPDPGLGDTCKRIHLPNFAFLC